MQSRFSRTCSPCDRVGPRGAGVEACAAYRFASCGLTFMSLTRVRSAEEVSAVGARGFPCRPIGFNPDAHAFGRFADRLEVRCGPQAR